MPEVRAEEPIRLGVALLAAGASSRMGSPKLLLEWGGRSVLEHLLNAWRVLGSVQTAVVCSTAGHAVQAELDRLRFPTANRIFNPDPSRGMFSSVQCAAAWPNWDEGLTHWALVLGDQPHVSVNTLRRFLEFAGEAPSQISQPSRLGRPRHPVVFPRAVLPVLAGSKARDLRELLQAWTPPVKLVEIDDPALDHDLDTPTDYEEALRKFAPGP